MPGFSLGKSNMKLSYTAQEKDRDKTVYLILRKELNISGTMLKRLKSSDAISVSGAPVFTNYKLTPGEIVTVDIASAEQPCDNIPEQGEIEVLFENDGLLAVNKPSGILVHPSRSRNTGTLSNFVAWYLLAQGGQKHSCSCHSVNRLDRDTSGVVLFAKNSYFKAIASEALSKPSARKEYLALVCGEMPACGVIDMPIKRKEERNMLRIPSQDGQRAVTHYETLRVISAADCMFSLVKLRLETGRTHQIRVHCLHIGHPVLGDKLYCNAQSMMVSQAIGVITQALHAGYLAFDEPLSGKYTEITAPWKPPIDGEKYPCILH